MPVEVMIVICRHVDGKIIPQNPFTVLRSGGGKKVPTILGTNRDEGAISTNFQHIPILSQVTHALDMYKKEPMQAMFENAFGKKASQRVMREYPVTDDQAENEKQYIRFGTDFIFACPTRAVAEGMAKSNREVYQYEFNRIPTQYLVPIGVCSKTMVCHGAEVPFIWRPSLTYMSAAEKSLSDQMIGYWVGLAKGDVNDGAKVRWPAVGSGQHLELADEVKPVSGFRESACKMWNEELGYDF